MSQVGLRDLHLAVLSTDDADEIVYEAPLSVAGAITATINPTVNTQELYADDQLWESVSALGAIDVEVETAELPLTTRGLLSGHTVEGDVLIEKSDTLPPHVALGFRSLKSNGQWRYIWLLKGVPQPIAEDYATKTDNVDHKTPRIRFTFMPRIHDSKWKVTADCESAADVPVWFDAVPDGTEITINTQPSDISVEEGSITESLTVAATVSEGGTALYQWYSNTSASNKGGTLLSGETTGTFSIPTDLTAGTYYFYAKVHAVGALPVASAVATVTVTTP